MFSIYKVELAMKKIPIVFSLVLLAACSSKEIPYENLVTRQGILYEVNSQTPFTGLSVVYHKNGQLEWRGNHKDGKEDGLHERYYKNGQLEWRENYKNGKLHGLYENYWSNGQLLEKINFINGLRQDGIYNSFDRLGNLSGTEIYRDGKIEGVRKGFIEGELLYIQNYKDGKQDGLSERYWPEYFRECYERGIKIDISYCEK